MPPVRRKKLKDTDAPVIIFGRSPIPKKPSTIPKDQLSEPALITQRAWDKAPERQDGDKENIPAEFAGPCTRSRKKIQALQQVKRDPSPLGAFPTGFYTTLEAEPDAETPELHSYEEQEIQHDAEKQFVTIGQPWFDFRREHDLGIFTATPQDEQKKLRRQFDKQQVTYSEKDPADHLEWPWIASKKCGQILEAFEVEINNRDPEQFDVYMGNDFCGYGVRMKSLCYGSELIYTGARGH
jgi:hypothetical protein